MFIPQTYSGTCFRSNQFDQRGNFFDKMQDLRTAIMQSMLDTSQDQNKRQSISQSLAKVQASKPILQTVSFVLEGYEQAKEVSVSGSFNFFSRRDLRMYRDGKKWIAEAPVEKGPLTDPNNPNTIRSNGNTNSVMEAR